MKKGFVVLLLFVLVQSVAPPSFVQAMQVRAASTRVANNRFVNQTSAPFEEGYVKTPDGINLYYRKTGSGPTVLVVPLRLFMFETFKQLGDKFTVISYDTRNRGFSSVVQDAAKITISDDIEDLEVVRKHFGLKKFSLAGYSYMGMGVILYAMKYPQYVERIIQLGPVPLKFGTQYPASLSVRDEKPVPDPAEMAKLEEMRKAGMDQSEPKAFCEKQWQVMRFRLVGNPANVEKLGSGVCDMRNEWPVNLARHFQAHFVSVQRLNISKEEVARVVRVPVLTIHGTKDRNAPYGAGREWGMLLTGARLLTVEGAAHQVFSEFPEVVFPAVRTFLNGGWPRNVEKVTSLERPAQK